ncbi:MAG: UDP-N-acetylglucosamine 1-carboxyvinyltransferase, partial [Candidatus Coproplasma sp.]
MDKYIINGGNRLSGIVNVQTAKNSVLPILAATVLTDGKVVLLNVPEITDVRNMVKILGCLGCKVTFQKDNLIIDSSSSFNYEIPSEMAHELRSSVFLLGSVVSRFHCAKIAYPGGCDIGLRPVDLHLTGLKRLGVRITEKNGYITCECDKLTGNEIMLDCPSVGATENIMLAAVMAEGTTVIKNAAREPEIEDLQNFLNSIGAKVSGAGSGTVIIQGVKKLYGAEYQPISDRIEAGTFLIGAAMCGGEVELCGANAELLSSLLHKLRENGCKLRVKSDRIYLKNDRRLSS